jgi:hypothetical protein
MAKGYNLLSAVGLRDIVQTLAQKPGREGKSATSVKLSETEKITLKSDGANFTCEADVVARHVGAKGGTVSGKGKIGRADHSASMIVSGREAAMLVYVMADETDRADVAEQMAIAAGAIVDAQEARDRKAADYGDSFYVGCRENPDYAHVPDDQLSEFCHFVAGLIVDGKLNAKDAPTKLAELVEGYEPEAAPAPKKRRKKGDRAAAIDSALENGAASENGAAE